MPEFEVSEIWRYPVKSMGGERIDRARVTGSGIEHDRGWAVHDAATAGLCDGKSVAGLMHCGARYLEGTDAGLVPHAEITLPGGGAINTDDARVHRLLSEILARPVSIWPLQPADNEEHYRRKIPQESITEQARRERLGLLADEPFPKIDASKPRVQAALQERLAHSSPRGTYFDLWVLHILTEASLRYLHDLVPDAQVDVRRFRPNILLADQAGLATPVEFDWIDRSFDIGSARFTADCPTPRCVMTTREQGQLPRASRIMRTLVRETHQNLGVYASVERAGRIGLGDVVRFAER